MSIAPLTDRATDRVVSTYFGVLKPAGCESAGCAATCGWRWEWQ